MTFISKGSAVVKHYKPKFGKLLKGVIVTQLIFDIGFVIYVLYDLGLL